jgi:hypothetical protein
MTGYGFPSPVIVLMVRKRRKEERENALQPPETLCERFHKLDAHVLAPGSRNRRNSGQAFADRVIVRITMNRATPPIAIMM